MTSFPPDNPDPSDPLARALARQRMRRTVVAVALSLAAVALPLSAAPLTGDPGARVGGVVGGVLCAALAVAAWPQPWSAAERRHRELDAIWRTLRPHDADGVPWARFAAWALPSGDQVDLVALRCDPARGDAGGE